MPLVWQVCRPLPVWCHLAGVGRLRGFSQVRQSAPLFKGAPTNLEVTHLRVAKGGGANPSAQSRHPRGGGGSSLRPQTCLAHFRSRPASGGFWGAEEKAPPDTRIQKHDPFLCKPSSSNGLNADPPCHSSQRVLCKQRFVHTKPSLMIEASTVGVNIEDIFFFGGGGGRVLAATSFRSPCHARRVKRSDQPPQFVAPCAFHSEQ